MGHWGWGAVEWTIVSVNRRTDGFSILEFRFFNFEFRFSSFGLPAAGGDHLKRRRGFIEGEVVGHEVVEVHHASGRQIDGRRDAPVPPPPSFQ
ncbi:MAG: hypothetical protein HYS33_09845 [Acidobacteria bacterium]|nr:hypothetical protein [Acidobacteriota bacterium]